MCRRSHSRFCRDADDRCHGSKTDRNLRSRFCKSNKLSFAQALQELLTVFRFDISFEKILSQVIFTFLERCRRPLLWVENRQKSQIAILQVEMFSVAFLYCSAEQCTTLCYVPYIDFSTLKIHISENHPSWVCYTYQ